ncbi:hypothetical protein JTE90_011034 [Oedothorax gibbosus]|uniref:Uncharacterized protein n=1 Tax=Oedothorax gibbosus TaxID=931172 RepID=A0AAV6VEH4_9ARAC|nr:hypothetical protein JTE90_011034 [Oedothorax gibbosus]
MVLVSPNLITGHVVVVPKLKTPQPNHRRIQLQQTNIPGSQSILENSTSAFIPGHLKRSPNLPCKSHGPKQRP